MIWVSQVYIYQNSPLDVMDLLYEETVTRGATDDFIVTEAIKPQLTHYWNY